MKDVLVLMAVLLFAPVTNASDAVSKEEARSASASTWLDFQRSGKQASATPQTLTPVIQERVVKRYLDSFNAPIPVFFAGSGMDTSLGGK